MDLHIRRHPSSSWWSETIFLWHVTEKLNIFLLNLVTLLKIAFTLLPFSDVETNSRLIITGYDL